MINKEITRAGALAYAIKTAENKNCYWEEEVDGNIPASPRPQYLRIETESVAGTQSEVTSEVKLKGRAPNEPINGSQSCSGSVNTEFPIDEYDKWLAYVLCNEWTEKAKCNVSILKAPTDEGTLTINLPDASSVSIDIAGNESVAQVVEKILTKSYAPYVAKVNPFVSSVVDFVIDGAHEFESKDVSIDVSATGMEADAVCFGNVKEIVPSDKTKTFYLLKEFTQNPAKYQLFRNVKVNSLTINCEIDAFVKLTWELMGVNNPVLEDVSPVDLSNPADNFTTKSLTTMKGSLKVNGKANRQSSTFELSINNNMESTQALFETEAIESSLGDLQITGNVTEYFTTGELYNRAINGEKTPIEICLTGNKGSQEVKYIIEVMAKFAPPAESGDSKISHQLQFNTFGNERFRLTKVEG